MAQVSPFHANPVSRPDQSGEYHVFEECPHGGKITQVDRVEGTGGYWMCKHCKALDDAA